MSKKKKPTFKYFITILILLSGVISALFYYYQLELKPVKASAEEVNFTINANSTVKEVLKELEEEELIHDDKFAYYYILFVHDTDFKVGDFRVKRNFSLPQLLDYLSDSANIVYKTVTITFIEGDWLKDIADRIAANTSVSAAELFAYWNDPEQIHSLMKDYPFLTEEIFNKKSRYALEGYLAPNTYEFYYDTNPEAITRTFLNETLNIYHEYLPEFEKSKLSIHEIFTLASIVQYEGVRAEDMQKIAGVFYNRLKAGYLLQSSVTVCYALDLERGADWRQCEFNNDYDSPYNTYKHAGLPPGPILNPGKIALEAVLKPAHHKYFYFMADVCGDGQIYFAKTFAEHQRNVNKYLNCY